MTHVFELKAFKINWFLTLKVKFKAPKYIIQIKVRSVDPLVTFNISSLIIRNGSTQNKNEEENMNFMRR